MTRCTSMRRKAALPATPADGARRVIELRELVHGPAPRRPACGHGHGLQPHGSQLRASIPQSVLDRIVPGYYQRYGRQGHRWSAPPAATTRPPRTLMMAKLMSDSVAAVGARVQDGLLPLRSDGAPAARCDGGDAAACQCGVSWAAQVQFIGEGWNFGEVANGARFVQASQLSLNGIWHRHLQRPWP